MGARAKNAKKIVGCLEYGRSWYFAFDIYRPLVHVTSKVSGKFDGEKIILSKSTGKFNWSKF